MEFGDKIFADRYKFIKLLGTGGMADVYLAEDILLNKKVAIKILKKELIGNRESLRYFKNEAEAISHLSHPNIVEVFDVGVFEGSPFIVMEYVDGKTLKEIIREKAPLSPFFAIHVMEGVLAALIHSHKKGVIHRDIKPHNIMVNRDGEVKVMDFGIARMTDRNATMTLTTDIVGSVHYLSPEQAAGKTITEQSDVYSSGIILYEMLTGRLPYEGENPVSVAVNHIRGGLTPPKDIVSDIPQELENVVLKATMRDPKKRFKSALEMNICIEKVRVLMEEGNINQVDRIPMEEPEEVDLKSGDRGKTPHADSSKGGKPKRDSKEKKNIKKIALISGISVVVLALVIALIVIFSGGEKKLVPNVLNLAEAQAKIKIEEAGFKYQTEGVYSDTVEAGLVVDQDPKGGNSVSTDTIIKLKVSKGKDAVEVPDVVGRSQTEAVNTLEKAQFVVEVQTAANDTVASGLVISQTPEGKTKELPGTTITIIVSTGPSTVSVPQLTGQTLESAEATLIQAGLAVGSISSEETGDYSPGQVIRQSVASGTKVNLGSTVDLVIAKELAQKTFTITYNVTPGTERNIELIITDAKGSRVETGTIPSTGSTFTKTITYQGTGTVVLKDNGTEVRTEQLP